MSLPPAPGFAPSAARGAALDDAVRARLADSLRAVADAADDGLVCDRAAIRALADAVAAHPVRPAAMLRYAEAVAAATGDDVEAAERCLAALAEPVLREPASPRIVTLRDADLGPGLAEAYRRLLDDDPTSPLEVLPLDDAALAESLARLDQAMDLLGPDFAGEIRALTPEILAVRGVPGAARLFDGATSFYLWGCIALNLGMARDPVELAIALAHESGHAALFALTMGEPATANPEDQRYASPLRADPRPMEGIVHATWVLARMHLATLGMLESGRLDAAGRAMAEDNLRAIERDYAAGLSVMAEHVRFTPQGAAAFAPAEAYMAGRGFGRS